MTELLLQFYSISFFEFFKLAHTLSFRSTHIDWYPNQSFLQLSIFRWNSWTMKLSCMLSIQSVRNLFAFEANKWKFTNFFIQIPQEFEFEFIYAEYYRWIGIITHKFTDAIFYWNYNRQGVKRSCWYHFSSLTKSSIVKRFPIISSILNCPQYCSSYWLVSTDIEVLTSKGVDNCPGLEYNFF